MLQSVMVIFGQLPVRYGTFLEQQAFSVAGHYGNRAPPNMICQW